MNRNNYRNNKFRGFPSNRRFFDKSRDSGHGRNWKKHNIPTKRLTEDDIGITEYAIDFQGFSGILKNRFSDFQVSEINDNSEIAKLTDVTLPRSTTETLIEEDEQLLLSKYNLEILPMETWDRIDKLSMNPQPSNEIIEIDATEMSKDLRTQIHDAVKNAFVNIISKTENKGDKKFICFHKYRKGARIDKRVKWTWPEEFVHFVLYKENFDTMEAATRLATLLGIRAGMIAYAGIKDRRAKTTQFFSIKKVEPSKILQAANRIYEVKVGNFTFANYSLSLGMLKGNRFRIALRNVKAPEEVVNKGCELLKEKGFLNYYGVQRFGTRINSPTYLIGLKILQNDFRKVVDHILEEFEVYSGGHSDYRNPLAPMLRALQKCPNNLVGAFDRLPRNRRLLYVHAYQSLVWNRAASERARRGLAPLPGDLVLAADNTDEINKEIIIENIADEVDDTVDEASDQSDQSEETSKKSAVAPVRVLTEEDVASGTHTIFDVVLPLPGHSVTYPPNMKEFYEETLKKDGLTLEMHHKMKPYRLSGAYRLLIQKPQDVEWKVVGYDDPCCDLIASDLDQLKGKQCPPETSDGKYKALLINMTLPSSSYATMALRELLRVDTSGEFQAKQNNYHDKIPDQTEDKSAGDKRKSNSDEGEDAKKPKTADDSIG